MWVTAPLQTLGRQSSHALFFITEKEAINIRVCMGAHLDARANKINAARIDIVDARARFRSDRWHSRNVNHGPEQWYFVRSRSRLVLSVFIWHSTAALSLQYADDVPTNKQITLTLLTIKRWNLHNRFEMRDCRIISSCLASFCCRPAANRSLLS